MITLSDINDLEKVIRAQLIAQSELNPKFVRNSLSLHGEALEKFLNGQIYSSIDNKDVLMLFELRSRDNESDMSEDEDGNISYYKSFEIYVMVYGDNGTNVVNNVVARFRTQNVRLGLRDCGVYLETVSNPVRINEYKNETMWIRNDFTIAITCHLAISKLSSDDPFAKINDVTVETL